MRYVSTNCSGTMRYVITNCSVSSSSSNNSGALWFYNNAPEIQGNI